MALFLQEESFCQFLASKFTDRQFSLGHSVISINVVSLSPIMSCLYYSENFFAAAKYNRQLEVFTDYLLVDQSEIVSKELTKQGLNYQLTIETQEKLANDQHLKLSFNLSSMTGTKWHKQNLKNIVASFSE
ncbi:MULTISPECIES: hypothetical protein [Enterococcus]|uniref:Uncharacterized protein n=1 Tax=Enterococcus alishanensis TaxID=1303817 RepID=A0ABS6TCC1_9ENTE|nr:hypothetical protein [Enterococcus alishanensis]MBV7390558.1 hypothetical protein [Enterococcus alishanensis]